MNYRQAILNIIPHTVRLNLAVVGFPSSGKSSLLSDIITSLSEMGFTSELPSLSYQHSTLGAFFNDAYNNDSGGIKQTLPWACRPTDHYGATMRRKGSFQRIAIEFLNIPGETFKDPEVQLGRYNDLRDALAKKCKKGLIELTVWQNPSGKKCFVIEPDSRIRNQYTKQNYAELIKESSDVFAKSASSYADWRTIYSELNHGQYSLIKRKSINGKYLLKHFFELNTDSVFATLSDVWKGFAPGLSLDSYKSNNAFNDFYYMHYCSTASHLVICDKLFLPKGVDSEKNYNFSNMCGIIKGLLQRNTKVYLAFRGADLMLSKCANKYRSCCSSMSLNTLRTEIYSLFMQQIKAYYRSGEVADSSLLDVAPEGFKTSMDGDLHSHLYSTIGADIAHCFRLLINHTGGDASDCNALPENVYFTATPIDGQFNFYDIDSNDPTRFVRRESDIFGNRWKAFHIEIARGYKRHFCFGTYQLISDILTHKNVILNI